MFEHDLFGKPLHTFPDHALAPAGNRIVAPIIRIDDESGTTAAYQSGQAESGSFDAAN
jgi:hypothetical protein